MTSPRVTVLMPVYNGEAFLNEAIDSILNQTFQDFEFLIINDGSTDSTEAIIQSYTDSRIRYEKNPQNLRLIATLNKGIDLARGEYIARMDADDISMPNRLEKQVAFMDSHPEVAICGTSVQSIGKTNKTVFYEQNDAAIKLKMLYQCHLCHPSIVIRKSLLGQLRFDSEYIHAEDYKLWHAMSDKRLIFANLKDILFKYRHSDNSISYQNNQVQYQNSIKIKRLFFHSLGIDFIPENTLTLYESMLDQNYAALTNSIPILKNLLEDILQANKNSGWLPDNTMKQHLEYLWFNLCYNSGATGKKAYNSSILAQDISFIQQLKWSLKLLLKR